MALLEDIVGMVTGAMKPVMSSKPSASSASNDDALINSILANVGSGGGSGGGGTPDWYYQGNLNNDSRQMDITEQHNKFNQDLATSQFNWQKTLDDRDYALSIGNFELAKQKQADANYWQQKTLEAQQSMNAADNASAERRASIAAGAEVQSASISAQAQIRAAEIRAAVDREAANKQLQANLANAVNDADRNAAYAAWNKEQAAIAKMEDDTKRQIAANDAKINLFGAETDRMNVAGQLAQKQNEFLLNAATSPRDLFGLYFMQRGVAPDWETMSNGGTPATGSPLVPQNALTAYVPQSGLPQLEFGAGPAYGNVGSATGSYSASANPFIAMGLGGGGGGGSSSATSQPQSNSVSVSYPSGSWANQPQSVPQHGANIQTDSTMFNAANGFPNPSVLSKLVIPGLSMDTPRYAEGTTDPIDLNPPPQFDPFDSSRMAQSNNYPRNLGVSMGRYGGMMSFGGNKGIDARPLDMPINSERNQLAPPQSSAQGFFVPPPQGDNRDLQSISPVLNLVTPQPQTAQNGFTTATKLMTGDAPSQNPWDGGARPEIIHNPTGAPLAIDNTVDTARRLDFPVWNTMQMERPNPQPMMVDPNQQQVFDPVGYNNQLKNMLYDYLSKRGFLNKFAMKGMNTPQGIERFALGTDASQQYRDAGLGQLWLGSSDNSWTNGMDLPNKLNMLKGYGVPLAPGLVNSATGQVSPTLNLGSAFAQRGGGILPSMQALNKMTSGEREMFQGYSEGVVGVPWRDTIDFLSRESWDS